MLPVWYLLLMEILLLRGNMGNGRIAMTAATGGKYAYINSKLGVDPYHRQFFIFHDKLPDIIPSSMVNNMVYVSIHGSCSAPTIPASFPQCTCPQIYIVKACVECGFAVRALYPINQCNPTITHPIHQGRECSRKEGLNHDQVESLYNYYLSVMQVFCRMKKGRNSFQGDRDARHCNY